jgi:DNA-binding response OmpR family regulator
MPKKILVVDDDPKVVLLLESRLKANKYEVIGAYDGKSCLKKAIQEKPDLILLDILMPGLNGFEVSKQLKNDARTQEIPVIMLTALAQEKDLSKGLEAGAACFITKPFSSEDLIYEIKQALQKEKD